MLGKNGLVFWFISLSFDFAWFFSPTNAKWQAWISNVYKFGQNRQYSKCFSSLKCPHFLLSHFCCSWTVHCKTAGFQWVEYSLCVYSSQILSSFSPLDFWFPSFCKSVCPYYCMYYVGTPCLSRLVLLMYDAFLCPKDAVTLHNAIKINTF